MIGAEAMFDWLPNTKNTVTATNIRASVRYWQRDDQQSMADDRDRQARLCVGPCAAVRQGRRRLGRREQFGGGDIDCTALALSGPSNIFGWTAGVGVEWAFWGNWSARAEYDYIGLNNQTYRWQRAGSPFSGDTVTSTSRNIQMVTAGVNYKFGWW